MTNFLMRIILQYLLFVGLTLIAADARAQAKNISFNNKTANPILQFAIEELKVHLGSASIKQHQTRFDFSFIKNGQLKNGAFSYKIQHASEKINVIFFNYHGNRIKRNGPGPEQVMVYRYHPKSS